MAAMRVSRNSPEGDQEERWWNASVITGGLHMTKHEFIWRIEHFDLILACGDLDILETQSTELTINAGESGDCPTKWKVFLEGEDQGDEVDADDDDDEEVSSRFRYIGVYFRLLESPKEEKIPAILGVSFPSVDATFEKMRVMHVNNHSRGWCDIFDKTTMLEEDGSVIFKISISIGTPKMIRRNVKISELEAKAGQTLIADMTLACSNPEPNDVVTLASRDGSEYRSSKYILSARSAVFKVMLNTDTLERRTSLVRMEDVSGKAVETMLNYIHGGNLLPSGFTSGDEILDVAYAADKYQLLELVEICDILLQEKWDRLNARNLLETTSALHLSRTFEDINEFIKQQESSSRSGRNKAN